MKINHWLIGLSCFHLALWPLAARSEPTPFANGDHMPEITATCQDLGHWIERLPDGNERVDMAIAGPLSVVESDGALAYLVICPTGGPQALCVTYSTNGMEVGEVVKAAGGTQRVDHDKVMLDPCLAVRE